jgi:hypothetical protein
MRRARKRKIRWICGITPISLSQAKTLLGKK